MHASVRGSIIRCLIVAALLSARCLLPFSGALAQTPTNQAFIRINQLGYKTSDPKVAIAFANVPLAGRFSVIEVRSQRTVFEGSAQPIAGHWGQFRSHAELDFSSLKKSGKFFLRFNATDSAHFNISAGTYNE